jgi:hypothetical protein
MRTVVAVVVGAGIAALTGLILGEYDLATLTPFAAALIIPEAIGAAMAAIDPRHRSGMWALTGLLGGAGLGWGVWIYTGQGLEPVPVQAWASVAIAMAWPLSRAAVTQRAQRHRAEPAPTP